MSIKALLGNEHTDSTVAALVSHAKSFLNQQAQSGNGHDRTDTEDERAFRAYLCALEEQEFRSEYSLGSRLNAIEVANLNGEVASALDLARIECVVQEWHNVIAWQKGCPTLDEHVQTLLGLSDEQLQQLQSVVDWTLNRALHAK